jgi:tetratricopeptide (TPR) repeat protein
LGRTLSELGSFDGAEALHREGLKIAREIGDDAVLGGVLINLAIVLTCRGRLADAWQLYAESLAVTERLQQPITTANALINMADWGIRAGRYDEARAHAQRALALFRRLGVQEGVAGGLLNLGEIALAAGALGEAANFLREALACDAQAHHPYRALAILINYAAVLSRIGESERAKELLALAVVHPATHHEERRKAHELLQQLGATQATECVQPRHGRALDEELKKAIDSLLESHQPSS